MHRQGANPADMQVGDFLCDFCGRAWDGEFPMVEGHHGSIICGKCLTVAYRAVVISDFGEAGKCTMCLEDREEARWCSPLNDETAICVRCVKQAAGSLVKDKDVAWEKPT